MSEETNILELFEGLSREQAQELTRRIVPTLEQVRHEITNPPPNGTGKNKGANEMTDEIELTEVEKDELRSAYDGIIAKRAAAAMQPRIEQYKKDMLAARGKPWKLKEIKELHRARGVPVDSVDFTGVA